MIWILSSIMLSHWKSARMKVDWSLHGWVLVTHLLGVFFFFLVPLLLLFSYRLGKSFSSHVTINCSYKRIGGKFFIFGGEHMVEYGYKGINSQVSSNFLKRRRGGHDNVYGKNKDKIGKIAANCLVGKVLLTRGINIEDWK